MGPVRQISEIRTEAFASNNASAILVIEVWFLWGLSRGKHELPTAKNFCVVFGAASSTVFTRV